MKKSYYDKKKNKYIDTTTNREYTPKGLCEICKSPYFLTVHHFLNQQKCLNDLNAKKVKHPKMWTKEFIDENQKLFTLCTQCHSDVERLSKEKFFEKYKREKSRFIWEETC
jgi:hypothetical protein